MLFNIFQSKISKDILRCIYSYVKILFNKYVFHYLSVYYNNLCFAKLSIRYYTI